MFQCENCGTQWTVHKLGFIPEKKAPCKVAERPCAAEYCPGCAAWLITKEDMCNVANITPLPFIKRPS